MLSIESSSSTSLPVSQFSLFPRNPNSGTRTKARAFSPCRKRTAPRSTTIRCHKMYVPGFGEASPEAKAAKHLHDFFTFTAVRIVSAQLQSYNPEAYEDLMLFLDKHSLNDGDKFCADLMRESSRHKALALRILEVRKAYCKTDFEWDNLQRLSSEMMDDRNTKLMRNYVSETSPVKNETEK